MGKIPDDAVDAPGWAVRVELPLLHVHPFMIIMLTVLNYLARCALTSAAIRHCMYQHCNSTESCFIINMVLDLDWYVLLHSLECNFFIQVMICCGGGVARAQAEPNRQHEILIEWALDML